jgi:hypothetical protein
LEVAVPDDDIVVGAADRPGPVRVLRTTDLVDLRFRFQGLVFKRPALDRILVRAAADREGWIVVTFPAQHVMERAFFESSEGLPSGDPPSQTEPRPDPPVVSRISGRSVLVFVVGADDEIPYTAEGLLGAMRRLPMRVVSEAGPGNPLRDPETDPRTGIELPYRLLLTPPAAARWSHRISPAPVQLGERVELWHTRVHDTTARAVWTRDFPGDTPTTSPPVDPVTSSLTSKDRAMFVYLTSDHGLFTDPNRTKPYLPKPIDVHNLMLSTLGGWLDSLGEWEPRPTTPDTISISQWRHRAAMGRDHYVRVMYAGFLAPFGHRAVLVKVTERKFDRDRPDHAAYLIQRMFIMVREPVKEFSPATVRTSADGQLLNLLFPFQQVELLTLVTPNLHKPANVLGISTYAFFPEVDGEQPFRFAVRARSLDGRVVEFRTPMLFLSELVNKDDQLNNVVRVYNGNDPVTGANPPPVNLTADLHGQSLALAPSRKPGDTTVEVAHLVWGVEIPTDRDRQQYQLIPGFLPVLRWAAARVPVVSRLAGTDTLVPVQYPKRFREAGFPGMTAQLAGPANPGELFLQLLKPVPLDFNNQRDRSGGLVAPSMNAAGLSRLTGPVSAAETGSLDSVANGEFRPSDFFKALGAKLFGIIPLADIIVGVTGLNDLKVPRFITQTVNAVTGFVADLQRFQEMLIDVAQRFPAVTDKANRARERALALVAAITGFSGDITPVDTAFRAFSSALDELGAGLPSAVDRAVLTLLQRVREAAATWDSATSGVLSLKQSLEALKLGKLLPETVNTRLEWAPTIKKFPETGEPLFNPHPAGRFLLVVDLRGVVRPDLAAGADITCTLEEFDLILVPGFQAMKLDFQRIRFTARAGQKLDIDIAFRGIEFIGDLKFVETLRKIIPPTGFSDPPALQVTPAGVTARYAMPLPNVAIGVFSLENVALSAYLDLPFIGRSMEIGFAFCRRDAPFRLTVSLFGGGGWCGIVLDPHGLRALDMALEFGAAASLNFGVASGSVSVMAGVYLRLETTGKTTLFGYFRARGEVDVLGLVSASIELYLALGYRNGAAVGRAELTISIEIGFFSKSVTITCEKQFAGSEQPTALLGQARGAATFRDMMAPYLDPVTGAQRDPVFEYCSAFARVA